MVWIWSGRIQLKALAACMLIFGMLLSGCSEDEDAPYLEFTGGGFIFNYRIGEAFYGFVARPLRDIPEGTKIIAEFENPAGGAPLIVTTTANPDQLQYMLRTPEVFGVVKDRPYKVTITLQKPGADKPLASYSKEYVSSINQSDMPDVALTIGPGYHPNPALYDPKEKAFVIPKKTKQ